jgi:hypothetical protein
MLKNLDYYRKINSRFMRKYDALNKNGFLKYKKRMGEYNILNIKPNYTRFSSFL